MKIDQAVISARLRGVSRWTVEDLTRLGIAFEVHPGVFWEDPKGFTPSLSSDGPRPAASTQRTESLPPSTGWLIAA